MTTTPTHQALQPEFRLLVFLVAIGFFMQGLDTTIINTAIPAIAHSLNEDPLKALLHKPSIKSLFSNIISK